MGSAAFQPEPQYSNPVLIPLIATIDTKDANQYDVQVEDGEVVIFGADGSHIGPKIANYMVTPALSDRYEIHSALVTEDDLQADVFAISDIAPLVFGPAILAVCLVLYAAQFALIKETMKDYRAQGYVAKWHMRGSFGAALTCRFDIDIEAQDRSGKVVKKKKFLVGAKKK